MPRAGEAVHGRHNGLHPLHRPFDARPVAHVASCNLGRDVGQVRGPHGIASQDPHFQSPLREL